MEGKGITLTSLLNKYKLSTSLQGGYAKVEVSRRLEILEKKVVPMKNLEVQRKE